jgi:hypothetical protein
MVHYALSIRQPWAELILEGRKDIETRSWNTQFRGEFLIHSSKQIDIEACKYFKIDPKSLITGALIGKAKIVGSKEYSKPKQYAEDNSRHAAAFLGFSRPKYGFILENIERIEPKPFKGALGFFKVEI